MRLMMLSNKQKYSPMFLSGTKNVGDLIKSRRIQTEKRFAQIKKLLRAAGRTARGKGCVYATGSFGRGEASQYSDLDLFIVGRTVNNKRALIRLDEICITADLVRATRKLRIPEFSGDGA